MKDQMTHAEAVSVIAEQCEEIEALRQRLSVMENAPRWGTYDNVCKQYAEAKAENDSLRAANKECVEYFNEAQKDLAASQAREQRLREALEYKHDALEALMLWCVKNINKWHFSQYDNCDFALRKMKEALALPQDTYALEAIKAKVAHDAGEVMRDRCFNECDADQYPNECDKHIAHNCRLAIRALPGVTLEDLKNG